MWIPEGLTIGLSAAAAGVGTGLGILFLWRVLGRVRSVFQMPPQLRVRLEGWAVAAGEPSREGSVRLWRAQLGALALGCCLSLGFRAAVEMPWICGVGLALAVVAWPAVSAKVRARRRARALLRAFPTCLELLTIGTEAGLDLVAVLAAVAHRSQTGPLRLELEHLLREVRLGLTREEAFRALALRVPLPAVERWVSAMVQAARSGAGVAPMLRSQARRLRLEEANRAEAAALRAPVKLLFPLLLFILPGTFMMLLGPLAFELFVQGGWR